MEFKRSKETAKMIVQFYSRPNCELCIEGLQILKLVQEDIPFQIEQINIEENDALHEKFMVMIPVVELNGDVIQFGRLDYPTLTVALSD